MPSGPDEGGAPMTSQRRFRLMPMTPRDVDEAHRASTPLELLFDLCFVVAVAQAGSRLSTELGLSHFQTGIVGYLLVFFGIWWAWVNFTWFASAYDVDDLPYRLLTFVQIVGVLILAAGVDSAFDHADFATITVGFVIMRLAMMAQWLRAASGDPAGRPVCLRYAVGIGILQIGWVGRLFLPHKAGLVAFYVLALGEMLVPAWAEHAGSGAGTPWHPGHITERYGLFTLIVLGEGIAAATVALHAASSSHGVSAGLIAVAAGAVLLVFSVWWWYFEHPAEKALRMSRGIAFLWGYLHYFVFGSVAALGAGLEVAAGSSHGGAGTAGATTAGLAVGVPVAVYLVVTGYLQGRLYPEESGRMGMVVAASSLVLLVGGLADAMGVGAATVLQGVVFTALVVVDQLRRPRVAAAGDQASA
jgi:low temperature requirement protein LtrA